jgi:hypothetical protein
MGREQRTPNQQEETDMTRTTARLTATIIGIALGIASPATTVSALAGGQPQLQAPRGQDSERPRGQDPSAPRGQDVERPRGQDSERPRGADERPRSESR